MRRAPCRNLVTATFKATFFVLVIIISLFVELNLVRSVSPPRNFGEAESVGFHGIVLNDDPQVLSKLGGTIESLDETHFADNLVAVYDYVKSLPYYRDIDAHELDDFWQTGPETIQIRGGDCEDHAILLVTLIEALYKETYGTIPQNLAWVVAGIVKVDPNSEGAGHAWAIINLRALPEDASSRIRNTTPLRSIVDVVIGDIILPISERIGEVWKKLDLARLANKRGPYAISVLWQGDEYVELESTWKSAISEYVEKNYPYMQVYVAFNSQQYVLSPQFVPSGHPVGSGAAIRNVAYDQMVKANERFSIKVTVRNLDLGTLGATLVLIVKSGEREVARESAYVLKYVWSIHTFSIDFLAATPGTRRIQLQLYCDNQGSLQLQDGTEFTVTIVSGSGTVATTETETMQTQAAVTVTRTVTVERMTKMTSTITRTVTRTATLARTIDTTLLMTVTANPMTFTQTRTGVVTSTAYSPTVTATVASAQMTSIPLLWLMLSTLAIIGAMVPLESNARLRTLHRRVEALFPFPLTGLTKGHMRASLFAICLISLTLLSTPGQASQQKASTSTTTEIVTVTKWTTLIQSVTLTRYFTSTATDASWFTRTRMVFTTITPTIMAAVDRRSTTTLYVPTTITETANKPDIWIARSPAVEQNLIQTMVLIALLIMVVFVAWKRSRSSSSAKEHGPLSIFCVECGMENPTTNEYCGRCGKRLVAKSIHSSRTG